MIPRFLHRLAAALVAVAALSLAANATKLRLYNAGMELDPNGNVWHLRYKICNVDNGNSGTVRFEMRLYPAPMNWKGPYWRIGARSNDPIPQGQCVSSDDTSIKVRLDKVPAGTYRMVFAVMDWDGSKYLTSARYEFDKNFNKNQ